MNHQPPREPRLLLASQSSARRLMLEAAGVPFRAVNAALDEDAAKAALAPMSAADLASRLAELKALAVAASEDALVLGADQTLELDDGTLLNKPASVAEAREQLRRMSGSAHQLHSAAVIAQGGRAIWGCCESVRLWVRVLSDNFIDSYIAAEFENARWCVGGYRIEGMGAQLFERIDGSQFAILGLPLLPLLRYLRERGILAS